MCNTVFCVKAVIVPHSHSVTIFVYVSCVKCSVVCVCVCEHIWIFSPDLLLCVMCDVLSKTVKMLPPKILKRNIKFRPQDPISYCQTTLTTLYLQVLGCIMEGLTTTYYYYYFVLNTLLF
eukprot:sb/3476148/